MTISRGGFKSLLNRDSEVGPFWPASLSTEACQALSPLASPEMSTGEGTGTGGLATVVQLEARHWLAWHRSWSEGAPGVLGKKLGCSEDAGISLLVLRQSVEQQGLDGPPGLFGQPLRSARECL